MSLIEKLRREHEMRAQSAAIRRRAGVTQAELAQEIGISRVTLARWEAGTCRPERRHLNEWLRLLSELETLEAAS